MIDVGEKQPTRRVAVASGKIKMGTATIKLVKQNKIKKGDVLSTSRLAGIMAAKKVPFLVPLCHNISIENVDIELNIKRTEIEIIAKVSALAKTGVEMEAITAVAVSAITIYDMCKAYDQKMVISDIKLLSKTGGKSDFSIKKK